MYTFIKSAIILLIQYAGKLIPEISQICLRESSRSLKMKLIITQGINATAIETMNEKLNALVSWLLELS